MPKKSNLVLTQAQEAELVKFATQRVIALKKDAEERIAADKASWLAYENDAKARAANKESIFTLKNIHQPLTSMVVDYFHTQAEESIVDDAPYFDFEPIGVSDVEKTYPYAQYYNWKLDTKAKTFATLQDGMLPIFIQRAAIFKASFHQDVKEWVDMEKEILFDLTTGQPIEILNHGPIIKDEDAFEDQPDPLAQMSSPLDPDAPSEGEMPSTADGQAEGAGTGYTSPPSVTLFGGAGAPMAPAMRKHLVADPTFIFDETKHQWGKPPAGLRRREVLYTGPKSTQVAYDRFLCPSDAKSIDEADVICELEDQNAAWFREMWQEGRPWAKWKDVEGDFTRGDATPKTEGQQKDDKKESLSFDTLNPKRAVYTLWIRRDVLGWGVDQEFVLFLDASSEKAIYYEFQAKICPDFKRPYTAIAVGKTKDRWWGKSIPEKVEQYQREADHQLNGELYRNDIRANPFKGGDKSALKDPNQEIVSDPNTFFEVKASRRLDEAIQTVTLPDADTRSHNLVDYIRLMVQRWLAVSDLAQGDYSDVPENNTATGIRSAREQSSKTAKRWNRRVLRGFEEHVLKLVQLAMATLDKNAVEVFQYFEGNSWKLGNMTAKDIREVEINVRLRLRQHTEEDNNERARLALEVQERYIATPPELRVVVRPLCVEILQSLRYKNIDELLPAPEQMPMPPPPAPGEGEGKPGGAPEGAPA